MSAVVTSVVRLPDAEREVYDLETEDGTFCTSSGLVLKNTDSIYCMFDVGVDRSAPGYMAAVFEVAERAAADVSKLFKRPIELEFEKVMMPFVLLTKKRYAYIPYTDPEKPGEMEAKGLAMVRRDTCPYAREGVRVLLAGLAPTAELTLSKSLKDEYKSNPPHVALVERMRARCAESAPRPGDRVAYVIVEGPKNAQLRDVVEDPAYAAANGLRLDYRSYYERQLKTPLTELLEVCGAKGALDATVDGAKREDKKRKDVLGFCSLFGTQAPLAPATARAPQAPLAPKAATEPKAPNATETVTGPSAPQAMLGGRYFC
jgi:DNA polymerase elongation subunit (family B)